MGKDAIGYFFIILLILIAAPLVFWILSMLYAWVKWLFNDKKKLNDSYSFINEFDNPVNNNHELWYNIGTKSEVSLDLTDTKFNTLRNLIKEVKQSGSYKIDINTKELGNGRYFVKLTTDNQTITKQIIIDN
ncbi:T9SS type A sorting domain-containing protein [Flavobacteriales bacterium]|jgi:hypothetical protein|nr:T9SS type A sorting domain-containing protein [Flavobacteriales bacterium]MDB9932668.1 T9SS type A sorting domain-containing protein [Flavobacteriales bacterium]MDC1370425.1 T9SS type A sorting domain-containing protein [Flavobacteriales bacterium]MDG1175385.1 T9SS type A sorting domain-containing protein [Flavobacteriales bacterium]